MVNGYSNTDTNKLYLDEARFGPFSASTAALERG
jgi:hypothetical protein